MAEYLCENCGKPFTRKPRAKNDHPTRFCGQSCRAASRHVDPLQRFWEHVRIQEGSDPCWIWTTARKSGYGAISINRKPVYAHRFAWQMFKGDIPEGLDVCHNCPGGDNKSCVNPDHLFLGTRHDNMVDAAIKGRGNQKLTAESVREIRQRNREGVPTPTLAADYGVGILAIRRVVSGKTWKHVLD